MRRQRTAFASLATAGRPDLVISGAESANPEILFTRGTCGRKRLWPKKVIYEPENGEMVLG